ncbi:MAG TPA: FtsW/RodA/SpoVE family cell cycle protein [Candidatus Elarobacter sp.]|nr:FtsW/RodA/SpoVE family cell cycle protein [Candidatus Elarobacter sp.]HEV2737159.1 FtsW/RodA/SpoVE family cell cycle protein [Candidatus Elarobacter sp.]
MTESLVRLRACAPMVVALVIAAVTVRLAPRDALLPAWLPFALGLLALAWPAIRPANVSRDDTLPALAIVLSAIGLAVVARLSPQLAQKQIVWLTFSLILAVAAGPAFDRFRVLAAYKYIWILGAIALFFALALFGEEVNGARLWIHFGPVRFEPVEVIKLLVVLFMASYLAETADVIARTRPWSLRSNAKYLGPLFVGWGISMMILTLERDLGMAALLLATFVAMLYVATRRIDLVAGAIAVFGIGAWWAATHYRYVETRIAVWKDPFHDPLGAGYQAVQSLFSLANGGLFGTGFGLGRPDYIPEVPTDYVYAAFGEEWGAIGSIALLSLFLALVLRALRVANRQPDLYAKLLATGLASVFGFQIVIIVGGVLHLFPLTGITLPFISYGGSSLVTNFLLVALVWAISSERRVPAPRAERARVL